MIQESAWRPRASSRSRRSRPASPRSSRPTSARPSGCAARSPRAASAAAPSTATSSRPAQAARSPPRWRAPLWSRDLARIRRKFEEAGLALKLDNGTEVGLLCSLQYDPRYGLSLKVQDADPAFALGELELRRRAILLRLESEGLFEPNRRLAVPTLPQRIGVVTSRRERGVQRLSQDALRPRVRLPHPARRRPDAGGAGRGLGAARARRPRAPGAGPHRRHPRRRQPHRARRAGQRGGGAADRRAARPRLDRHRPRDRRERPRLRRQPAPQDPDRRRRGDPRPLRRDRAPPRDRAAAPRHHVVLPPADGAAAARARHAPAIRQGTRKLIDVARARARAAPSGAGPARPAAAGDRALGPRGGPAPVRLREPPLLRAEEERLQTARGRCRTAWSYRGEMERQPPRATAGAHDARRGLADPSGAQPGTRRFRASRCYERSAPAGW